MNQTTLSRLEATLSPEQLDFRLDIAKWLNNYPWTHLWTPTFKKAEERGHVSYTRSGGQTYLNTPGFHGYARTGGGVIKPNPYWKGGEKDSGLHVSGFSERAAISATKRFLRRFMTDYSYFFVAEKNPNRDGHHVHCLLIPPAGRSVDVRGLSAKWWNAYGWNKFERIRKKSDVTGYCTKHVSEYLNKGDGWYEIEINDSEIFHSSVEKNERQKDK